MAGQGMSGGSNVWGQLLSGVLEGVVQKMAQKTGPSPDAPKKDTSKEAEGADKGTTAQNPTTQTASPMTGAMLDLLSKLAAKMQGPAVAQQAPTAASQQQQQQQPGQSFPDSRGQPQQQTPSQGDAGQQSLLRKILDGISKTISGPMNFATRQLNRLNTAIDDPDELIEQTERIKQGKKYSPRLAAAGYGIRAFQQDRPLQGVGDISAGAGEIAGEIPGVGKPTQSFFKLNELLLKSVDRLKTWNDRLHEGNIRFAEFSGQMFAVAKEQEARDIQLSQKKGEELAASARFQAEQKSRLDNQLMTIENFWKNAENYVTGYLSKLAADALKLTPLGREELGKGMIGLHSWMQDVTEMEARRESSLIPPPKRWGPT